MRLVIHTSRLKGSVDAVPSKSAAHRHLLCAALAAEETVLYLPRRSEDIDATIGCIRAMGAEVLLDGSRIRVRPIHKKSAHACHLDCAESGSTLRFLMPIVAALGMTATFTGRNRLLDRPNDALIDQLESHGAKFSARRLPWTVDGQLKSGVFHLPGNISSQYATGLLLAAPLLEGPSEIHFTTAVESAGYLDLTREILFDYGIAVERALSGYRVNAPQRYTGGREHVVEGDWSSAAFWLAANWLGSEICVEGLAANSRQPDMAIRTILARFSGANAGSGTLEIDAANIPDLVPILAVAAVRAQCDTRIHGAARLRYKESDRLFAISEGLSILGADITEHSDGLTIRGGRALGGGVVYAHNDHRIAMALAIAALICDAPVVLEGAEAAAKSYPNFFEDYIALGGKIDVQ